MKSKPPTAPDPTQAKRLRPEQPSVIEVRDSWIDAEERGATGSSLELATTLRPPALTLPDDALVIEEAESGFPDYEAPTLPRVRAFRPLLGSQDEASLLQELRAPQSPSEPKEAGPKGAKKRRSSRAPRRTTTSPPAKTVQELDLSSIRAFEDLSPEMQYFLLADGTERRVGASTALEAIDTLLVVKGGVRVGLSRGEGAGGIWSGLVLHAGEVVTCRSSLTGLGEPVILGGDPGTVVVSWSEQVVEHVLSLCPWIDDSLREEGDRLQTLMLLARKLRRAAWRDMMRLSVLTRLEVRLLGPGQVLWPKGDPVGLLALTGFGTIELTDGDRVVRTCVTGEPVHPAQVLSRGAAPQEARAAESGATVLLADAGVVSAAIGEMPVLARLLRSGS